MKHVLLPALLLLLLGMACSPVALQDTTTQPEADAEVTTGTGDAGFETVDPPCGDGECSDKETCETCAADCGECVPCGDGECTQGDEDCSSCPDDCGPCCPNEACDFEETCESCPLDCGACEPECTDGECNGDETCESCPEDCGECAVCPNGVCDEDEDCQNCSDDCGECECGDGDCTEDETCESCSDDCGDCVGGDDECNGDETCESCPDDCTDCDPVCGDGKLQPGEECDDGNTAPDDGCDEECMIEPQPAAPGSIIITEILKNPDAVDDALGEWFEIYNTTEDDIDINGWMLMDAGIDKHTIFALDGVVVPAESFFVLAKDGDSAINGGVEADYVYEGFNLSNKDDEIILEVYEVVIDEVAYDNGGDFPGSVGKSLSLAGSAFDAQDNDDGSNWCDGTEVFGDGDFGTPGADNPECVDPAICGDDECWDTEDCESCPDDCGECCGNGECDFDETCDTCPADCDECCGNGLCDADFGETCDTCVDDCGECCGNGECDFDETCLSCSDDCGECCGDGQCVADQAENCNTCPDDCTQCCGDGSCLANEDCDNCAADCGACCGNGLCDFGETCDSCQQDCNACCGNGECDFGETCQTCPGDCDECPSEGWCQLSGDSGQEIACEIRIAAENAQSEKATQFQFDMNFDAGKVGFAGTKCVVNGMDICSMFGVTESGHSVNTEPQSAGVVRVTLTASGAPKSITDAYVQGQSVQGEPYVLDLRFTLNQNIAAGQAVQVSLTQMVGSNAAALPVYASQQTDGLIVTSASDSGPECGDGQCDIGLETCQSCSADCGNCCGNGDCDFGETCQSCSADCNACCGNGECDFGETCGTCPLDCDPCPDSDWCEISGTSGQAVTCDISIAAQDAQDPKATQFQFDLLFDADKVDFTGTECIVNGMDICTMFGVTASGHSVNTEPQSAGVVRVTLTASGAPKAITDAYLQGQTVQGEPYVLDLKFTLSQDIGAGQAMQVSLTDMKGSNASALPVDATQQSDGLIVTHSQ